MVENIVRKGEIAPFLTMFSTAIYISLVRENAVLCGNGLNDNTLSDCHLYDVFCKCTYKWYISIKMRHILLHNTCNALLVIAYRTYIRRELSYIYPTYRIPILSYISRTLLCTI